MRKLFTATVIVATVALAAGSAAPAFARGGSRSGGAAVTASGSPAGFSHGNKTGWGGGTSPPGWSHGNKTGWGGGTMPPGLSRR